ncbi:MAG: LiaF transmembrane domain-containing protein, partial [Clostridium sp.]
MKKGKVFWGMFLILGGIALVVDQLELFSNMNIINVIIAIFLLCIVVKNIIKVNFAGILFPLAFIGILFDEQLGIEL